MTPGAAALIFFSFLAAWPLLLYAQDTPHTTQLPNGKRLAEVPGHPRKSIISTAVALSRTTGTLFCSTAALASYTSDRKQSLSVLNLENNELTDFPTIASRMKLARLILSVWPLVWTASTSLPAWPR